MQFKTYPWPLSELTTEDAANILAMSSEERESRLRKVIADIKSGELARRQRLRAIDERNRAQ